jgi:NADH:ubiquinone oxidoreductase subunit F (NADH-binding)/NAD-dependent dihydropyrimidine dehydrogenase PreA subunit
LALEPNEKQLRIVLRNCGQIDPENFDDYIAADGYAALKKVITEYRPEQVFEQLKASGLRGRGGAGYPTWMKWNFARQVKAEQKYIVCNGDEGDPGAYMDRSVLEGDPHSVIEGMMIGAYAIGASQGYFYIRAEYPLAVERIQKAIAQAYEYGLLGKNILGTDFSFDVEIRLGAGAFVCGEETALLASIEGKRGTPQPRPPYPSIKGLWGKPTVINNVETLANIPVILLKGGAWFGKIGTEKSKGTKVFALTGKIKNSGLIEVPMGTTIRDIVYHIGGGMLASKGIKAVQTGGPSGGVIPKEFLDEPVDYENLQKLGSIMGSGGMIVMDEDDCLVDIAKFYLKFCVEESCGKCAPCRIGGFQMLSLLENITSGKGTASDLAKMRRIALAMQKASLCGLGQTASNPVLSTLKYFAAEYKSHIEDKKCVAGKCRYLLNYQIIPEKCKKCGLCLTNCVFGAITGNREQGYILDPAKCTKCGRCYEVCKFKAINKG